MCTQKSPYNWSNQLYARHGESLCVYLQNKVLPALVGTRESEQLLEEFLRRWLTFKVMNEWYRKFFNYLVSGLTYHVAIA